jgi:arylsulfatase A-like enzyme
VIGLAIGCAFMAWAGCEREPTTPVRVVLVTLDTLRYDAVAGAGAMPTSMPRLMARVEQGAWFKRFYAATSTTQPSHATMFTALHPWEHGVTGNGDRLDDRFVTVAEAFKKAGFETRAVVAAYPVAARFGFAQGFDAFGEEFTTSFLGLHRWEGHPVPKRAFSSLAETVTERALESLDTARAARQFFWFHYFDPHAPYGSTQGGTLTGPEVIQRVAAGEVADDLLDKVRRLDRADTLYLDRSLDRLLTRLEADGSRYETHVVLVADHGESIGEGGSLGHGDGLSDEQIHVPALFLSWRMAPGVREDVAGSIDVAPTLLALAGLEPWDGDGRDLTRPGPVVSGAVGMRRTYRDSPPTRRRLDGKEHVLPDLLFYAVDDRGHVRRGNGRHLADAADASDDGLRERFAAFEAKLAALASRGALDPEVERVLRSLGYVP